MSLDYNPIMLTSRDKKLEDLLLKIESEHQAIDKLIADLPVIQSDCGTDSDDEAHTSTCRAHIRNTLADYLYLLLKHFEHEHQVMHLILYPPALLDDHASEHSVILDEVNRVISKPLSLMEELVAACGERILDPFMGSATTGLAALNQGKQFTGIEASGHYFEVAVGRLKAG